jgi:hypothetical protein
LDSGENNHLLRLAHRLYTATTTDDDANDAPVDRSDSLEGWHNKLVEWFSEQQS